MKSERKKKRYIIKTKIPLIHLCFEQYQIGMHICFNILSNIRPKACKRFFLYCNTQSQNPSSINWTHLYFQGQQKQNSKGYVRERFFSEIIFCWKHLNHTFRQKNKNKHKNKKTKRVHSQYLSQTNAKCMTNQNHRKPGSS